MFKFNKLSKLFKIIFTLRNTEYSLRGTHILNLPKPSTTTFGLHSLKYFAAKTWNSLSDKIRSVSSLREFVSCIREHSF